MIRPIVLCAFAWLLAGPAAAGEYRDPNGAFLIRYDDAVWSIDDDGSKDFSVSCARSACGGAVIGCSSGSAWVPFGNVRRLTDNFDGKDIERVQLEELAKHKASVEQDAQDVPPQVTQPYTRRDISGHPFFEAEFRLSMTGRVGRYMSFSTSARGYSLVFVCHVPEDRIAEWRPRFDTLMQGFKPLPRTGWLWFLELVGL